MVISLALGGPAAGIAEAAPPVPANMIQPDQAMSIAAGLADATGDLALQCGMGSLGSNLRGTTPQTKVASKAVQASLAFAGAKKGCKAAVEVVKAIAVIVYWAEQNQPVYIALDQSEKRKRLVLKECTVVIHAGESQADAREFRASFTC
jgi:hypothetical protein